MSEEAATFEWRPFRAQHRQQHDDKAHSELDASFHEHHPHDRAADNRPDLIESADRLGPALDLLREAGVFGFDTEFIGEESYYPKVCLVQAATAERVEVIDALADLELAAFWELVADPSVGKIVHAGAQDLEPCVRLLGKPPAAVLDTQVAAAFAGFGYPTSLAKLVEELTGASLGKGLKFSDWRRRPLSEVQLTYAANDVRYLVAMAEAIEERLEARGNRDLAHAACAELCHADRYVTDPLERKLKAKGVGSMGRKKRSALHALLLWREELARTLDAPPRSVLPDQVLADIAGAAPADPDALQKIKGMPRPIRARFGEHICAVVAYAREHPTAPRLKTTLRTDEDRDAVQAVWNDIESRCADRSIDPRVVTSKKELMSLRLAWKRGEDDAPQGRRFTEGWRSELLNGELDRLR